MFRLIGIGVSGLCDADGADFADLIDRRSAGAEQAMDRLRERFGEEAVVKGLALEGDDEEWASPLDECGARVVRLRSI